MSTQWPHPRRYPGTLVLVGRSGRVPHLYVRVPIDWGHMCEGPRCGHIHVRGLVSPKFVRGTYLRVRVPDRAYIDVGPSPRNASLGCPTCTSDEGTAGFGTARRKLSTLVACTHGATGPISLLGMKLQRRNSSATRLIRSFPEQCAKNSPGNVVLRPEKVGPHREKLQRTSHHHSQGF